MLYIVKAYVAEGPSDYFVAEASGVQDALAAVLDLYDGIEDVHAEIDSIAAYGGVALLASPANAELLNRG